MTADGLSLFRAQWRALLSMNSVCCFRLSMVTVIVTASHIGVNPH